jgi:hypothetical protein
MPATKKMIVTGYAKMWPRTVFDIKAGNKLLPVIRELLHESGVYVLYREDQPYYVGKAIRLSSRIWAHANQPKDRYYNFWNYFSAFVVPDTSYLGEVEGLLIASMPTENSSVPRIRKIHMPASVASMVRAQRIIKV